MGAGGLHLPRHTDPNHKIPDPVRPAKVYMEGFGNNRLATGVHDDLYVRCLALAAGNENVVMCSAEPSGAFHRNAP